jgi:hypothetical protein
LRGIGLLARPSVVNILEVSFFGLKGRFNFRVADELHALDVCSISSCPFESILPPAQLYSGEGWGLAAPLPQKAFFGLRWTFIRHKFWLFVSRAGRIFLNVVLVQPSRENWSHYGELDLLHNVRPENL